MFARSVLSAAVAFSLAVPSAGSAQGMTEGRRLVFFANGGGNSPVADLNDAGTASLKTGWTAGAGIGFQISRYVAIRGTFDFARAEGEGPAVGGLLGQNLNQYFYGGDVQLRYPTRSGFAPYLVLGAGAVTIDNADLDSFESFTKFAGKGGVGLEYRLPRSNVGFFAQGTTYLYDYDRSGFDKTQVNLLWTGGLTYRLPL